MENLQREILAACDSQYKNDAPASEIVDMLKRVIVIVEEADKNGEFFVPCHRCGCLDCGGWNCP